MPSAAALGRGRGIPAPGGAALQHAGGAATSRGCRDRVGRRV